VKKITSKIILILLLTSTLTLAFNNQQTKANPNTIYVDDDNTTGPWDGTLEHPYQNITAALEHALDNDTIRVNDGTYYENLIVNKTVTLIGDNPENTIIDGSNITMTVVLISKVTGVKIQGFTIRNSGDEAIVGGIHIFKAQNVKIYDDTITKSYPGVLLTNSTHCEIFRNKICSNVFSGIYLRQNSNYNQIVGNTLINHTRGIHFTDTSSENNNFYHNNLINNTEPVWIAGSVNNNWDDGYPSGGNYWSDYVGNDVYSGADQDVVGADGIGDMPYDVDGKNDSYPLLAPIYIFDAGTWNETAYNIDVISNSTISNFQIDKNQKIISFNVTDKTSLGFCRVTLPNVIVQEMWKDSFTVQIDEQSPLENRSWIEEANTYIYFTYEHPLKEITIMMEFPSALILLLFMVLSLTVVTVTKKRFHRKA